MEIKIICFVCQQSHPSSFRHPVSHAVSCRLFSKLTTIAIPPPCRLGLFIKMTKGRKDKKEYQNKNGRARLDIETETTTEKMQHQNQPRTGNPKTEKKNVDPEITSIKNNTNVSGGTCTLGLGSAELKRRPRKNKMCGILLYSPVLLLLVVVMVIKYLFTFFVVHENLHNSV